MPQEVVSKKCEIEQEKSLLTLIKIISSSKYKSESKINIGSSLLPVYTSLPPTSPSSIDFPLSYHNNNMSQHDL